MGTASQYAGGIWNIRTEADVDVLLSVLNDTDHPVGVDTETIGVDPTSESPVGRGRIFCWSLAFIDPELGKHETGVPLAQRVFLPGWTLERLTPWLESDLPKVGHGIFEFDKHLFANQGIQLGGILADTVHMSRLLQADKNKPNGLKHLMSTFLGYELGAFKELFSRPTALPPDKKQSQQVEGKQSYKKIDGYRVPTYTAPGDCWVRFNDSPSQIPLDELWEYYPKLRNTLVDYASLDAKATLELYFYLKAKLADRWRVYQNLIHPSLYALYDISRRGIRLDTNTCTAGLAQAENEIAQAKEVLEAWAPGVNWASPTQVSALFYTHKSFPVPRQVGSLKASRGNTEGKLSTDEGALHWLHDNVKAPADRAGLEALIKLRKAGKYATYLRDLPTKADANGRIHTKLSPSTDTGRLSSSCPNLQQIPTSDGYSIRKAFIPDKGSSFVVADFSQLEMYVLAHYLIDYFDDRRLANDLLTGDIHTATAHRAWPGFPADQHKHYRDMAKTLNYAVNYGKSASGLGWQIRDAQGSPIGREAAQSLLDAYFKGYPAIQHYQRIFKERAHRNLGVPTLLGRWRPLEGINATKVRSANEDDAKARRKLQGNRERQAINTPIQGSAADIVTSALIKCHRDPELAQYHAYMVLQVHDELIFEVPTEFAGPALERIVYLMEHPVDCLLVPLKVDAKICSNWAEGK